MALWAAVIGVGLVGFEVIVADTGWADPSHTPTSSPENVMPTSASGSAPVTTPSGGSADPTATPSQTPSPSASVDPTPSTSTKGRSSERYDPAGDPAPLGRYEGSRVMPASPAATSGAAAAPPRSPTPGDQGGEIPVETRYLSRAVAQGLIFGGAAGFVVSLAGMVLVGWIRRRV